MKTGCLDVSCDANLSIYFNQFSQQSTTQQYVVHKDFLGTPFQLDSSSGELIVSESLQKEGTLSMYDIVIVADQGQKEAWTVTTIVIGEIVSILIPNHACLYSTFVGPN